MVYHIHKVLHKSIKINLAIVIIINNKLLIHYKIMSLQDYILLDHLQILLLRYKMTTKTIWITTKLKINFIFWFIKNIKNLINKKKAAVPKIKSIIKIMGSQFLSSKLQKF
jgi:hypothetical protein